MELHTVFLHFVNTAVSAGWVVLGVLVLRLVLMKAPKWTRLLLWAVVGARLVFPVKLQSVFSLIPSSQTIDTSVYSARPYLDTGISAVDDPANAYLGSHYFEGVTVPNGLFENILTVLGVLWLVGLFVLLVYAAVSYLRLRASVRTATRLQDNVFESEQVSSPFILGIFRVRIYLPYGLSENDRAYVLAHEQAHLKRCDHLVKPLAFLALCLYWFQPLLWLAYILLCRDMELACDEKAVQAMDRDTRRAYSMALLRNSVRRSFAAASPLAFGETSIKERVKSVMHYKKPAVWVVAGAVALCCVAGLVFATDPLSVSTTAEYAHTEIGAHTWQFETLQMGGHVVACSAYQSPNYPKTPVLDLTLTAQEDQITIENASTGEQWQLSCEEIVRTPDGIDYEITAPDGTRNLVHTGITEYADGSREYTLPLSIGSYAMQFSAPFTSADLQLPQTDSELVYTLNDSARYPVPPQLTLSPDGQTFTLSADVSSSYLPVGTYSVQDGVLILQTQETGGVQNVYRFILTQVHGQTYLVFDGENSSPLLPPGASAGNEAPAELPDGAVFSPAG